VGNQSEISSYTSNVLKEDALSHGKVTSHGAKHVYSEDNKEQGAFMTKQTQTKLSSYGRDHVTAQDRISKGKHVPPPLHQSTLINPSSRFRQIK